MLSPFDIERLYPLTSIEPLPSIITRDLKQLLSIAIFFAPLQLTFSTVKYWHFASISGESVTIGFVGVRFDTSIALSMCSSRGKPSALRLS